MHGARVKVLSGSEMAQADRRAQELGVPQVVLMERAGVGMARIALERFAPRSALILAGGGNNGGDGFVVARELHRAGVEVSVLLVGEEYSGGPKVNLDTLRNLDVRLVGLTELEEELSRVDLVVDALLGTGVRGAPRAGVAGIIGQVNSSQVPVLAVDIPSGVNADTGEVEGVAVRAAVTVAAHAVKLGCVISPGREYAGENIAVDIGIPAEACLAGRQADVKPVVEWTDRRSLHGVIPRLSEPAHKYSAGALLVVAGSRRMTGAAAMVCLGAQRAGCGIVFLVTPESAAASLDARLTEVLVYGAPEDEDGAMTPGAMDEIRERAARSSAVVAGPGIGGGEERQLLIERLLAEIEVPILLDADAVTALAGSGGLVSRRRDTVITPHTGELGKLMQVSSKEVSAHRLAYARRAAREQGCCVLLKGADTMVVEGGRTAVNSTGDVALATAGTGDILSGMIGALISRGMSAYEAARAGAWAHGRAAQLWRRDTGWPAESLIATDLLNYIPQAIREIY